MPTESEPTFLLASNHPKLLSAIEPVLRADGARVEVVPTAEAALARMTMQPAPILALLDAHLPGMEMQQMLAAVCVEPPARGFPIVVLSNNVSEEWKDRLAEGVIDDLLPVSLDRRFLRLRLDMVLRTHQLIERVEKLRDAAIYGEQHDALTGAYNREAMLNLLFRETDRVQRMNTSLCLALFDVDDFGHWNERVGTEACNQMLVQVSARTGKLLRSYDLLGRVGGDEFLAGLPGCTAMNAVLLAERMRTEVFAVPFRVAGKAIRLSACFGVAASQGRSPVVVLREAEEALGAARKAGPESIQCAGECPQAAPPVAFLSPSSGDDLLAW